jgi:hypothetical protein
MRNVDRSNQIDFKHPRPIVGRKIPERESKLPGANSDAKHNVIWIQDGSSETAHLLENGHIALHKRGAREVVIWIGRSVESVNNRAFVNESTHNRRSDAPCGTEHGYVLTGEVHLHNQWVLLLDHLLMQD